MAEIIPSLGKDVLARMTSGEKRFVQRLKSLLEDDYIVWYDIPVGRQRRYPDFIVLHPARGLLFLEVKDWKIDQLRNINKKSVTYLTATGLTEQPHPLEQARQYGLVVVHQLQRDPLLQQTCEKYQGKLAAPWGVGVVLTNITRKQMANAVPEEVRERLLPDHLIIYKDEMTESADAEEFQSRLWAMFNYQFPRQLTLPQMDRIRAYLFPEIVIDTPQQDFFPAPETDSTEQRVLPDIVRIMDVQQEQLARSLGEGHRVIHGVAGSGKTLILGFRAEVIARLTAKPVLILCYNISLAAKLRSVMEAKGLTGQVQVYHFHDWCKAQLKTYSVDLLQGGEPIWERQVFSVMDAVDKGRIPRAQYGAVMIDEGHDFEAEWLTLVVQMVDPESNSLLLLYDDAQSIYKKKSGLDFTLSSVGIQAQGRTTVLRLNYRNTREILDFAYRFAADFLTSQDSDEDHIPLIAPEAAGTSGPAPAVISLSHWQNELEHIVQSLQAWREQGMDWRDMAVLYVSGYQGSSIDKRLTQAGIPHLWMGTKAYKQSYDPTQDRVTVLTMHSSKGLEFPAVILAGIGQMKDKDLVANTRLVYVGMTRAQAQLQVLLSGNSMIADQVRALG
ncbi:3'-5' exonuclease [Halioxenophilus sp. WMMB6]|uniref:3'-5' exonuclease n=1 Tax=Halioxenophilus sp. WMMB6 TaxID=3073815 RepID=UPI00295E6118|nr:3'-5' exonuclease [Halioxenophilus sp. WMMB6]